MENNKPIALFLGAEADIQNAYAEPVRNALGEHLRFFDRCYDAAFIEQNKSTRRFQAVEYIFSTWGMVTLNADEVKRIFPALKAVFYAAGSVQHFAKPFMENGVRIFSAWGANAVPVAEVAVSEIILANKGFFQTLHNGQTDQWTQHDSGKPYPGNYNTSIGILGAGMIGTLVIQMLKNYKLNVFVFDPFLPEEKVRELGVTKLERIEEVFERCSVISNHLANNAQTENIINRSCFEKMGENAVFLNTGRGRQVNENDLIDALTQKPNRAAVLDVTYPEPPESGSRLYSMSNVFLSPHLAGSIGNEIQRMGEYMLNEFLLFSQGQATRYEVSEKMLATMA
ncbi:MAG TPA: hypothetical protein DDY98_04790 [Ruminococcaceae bacterium]|nr:hypothetical protein [Oscillospiraceae bacterium]